ncbi:hypothetical protein IMCC3317_13650 [Kordia antarctica]|uniref:4Fe4S-binding SPASM domain-containing protein n=1 Tax=Kordia antarctica TaxID=1218801 RepID=A0A7L4ZHA8_9FLAO|nr:grasp-with-spasm system SPASM domain peptide maturase [Kordia antarctica]QHI36012.1 hypothetical protein IMCC3317_13650 [Kordia antarctica]
MKLVRFENCVPVKGHSRATICDLQRNRIKLIPNTLYEILTTHNGKSVAEIKTFYKEEDYDTVDEYIAFLIANEFVFLAEEPQWFPKLSMEWESPDQVTNAIADIDAISTYDLFKFLQELNNFSCNSLQLRFYDLVNMDYLEEILQFLEKSCSSIIGVECYIKYSKFLEKDTLINFVDYHSRLLRLIVHSAEKDEVIPSEINDQAFLFFTKQNINSQTHCGIIHKDFFTVNLPLFTESQKHNSCLNRKISIDANGNIKNCPSMPQSFGNIENTTLQEALHQKDFKKYWNITKDQIDICKDCEFRYVCTDCRAYTENPEDEYSKPLKCGYNPYTNEWSEWSVNPLKQKAIEYYKLQK